MSPAVILTGAFLWDVLLGELPGKIHPVVFMGNYISFFWKHRLKRNLFLLFITGVFILLSGASLFYMIPWGLNRILPELLWLVFSVPLLKSAFSVRGLILAGDEICRALEKGDLKEAQRATGWHLVSRNTDNLTKEDIASCVVESLAENITDSFTTPIMLFLGGGVPLAWAGRFINTSDAMIAYRKGDKEWGGKFTAWSDTLINYIPARITGFAIVMACALNGLSWKESLRVMLREKGETASPNAGWTMAAMAGGLGVTLRKEGEYTLNGGKAPLDISVLKNCRRVTITAILLLLLPALITGVFL